MLYRLLQNSLLFTPEEWHVYRLRLALNLALQRSAMSCRRKCGLFRDLTWHSAGVLLLLTLLPINIALLRSEEE